MVDFTACLKHTCNLDLRVNKMNHFRGHQGYSLLVFFLSLGLGLGALLLIGLLSMLKVPGTQLFAPIAILIMLFTAAFIMTGRFLKIENRAPKLYDANTVATQSAVYLITFFVSMYSLSTLIVWILGGEISKLLSVETLSGAGAGILGLTILCYLMTFLNFMLVSKVRTRAI